MAALMDIVKVSGIPVSEALLSVSDSRDSQCVILTFTTGQAYLYQISEQKVVCSWSCRHNQKLTSGVVQLDEDKYAAVISEQILRVWKKEELLIDKGKKTTLKKKAYAICSVPDQPPMVLFADGSVSSLEQAKQDEKEGPLGNSDTIVWHSVLSYNTERGCLVAFVRSEKDDAYKVLIHWLEWEGAELRTTQLLYNTKNSTCGQLLDWDASCSQQGDISVFLLVSEPEMEPEYKIKKLTFTKGLCAGRCECLCTFQEAGDNRAMVVAGEHHAVVAGLQDQQLSLRKDNIGLIDLKFSAVQQTRPFPSGCNKVTKMFKTDSYLVVTDSQSLWALPYTTGPSRLSSLLGKFTLSAKATPVMSDTWNSAKTLNQQDSHLDNIKDIISKLADVNKIKSQEDFAQEFERLMSSIHQVSPQVINLSAVLQRCLQEKHFWPRSEVNQLITSGHVPTGCNDGLISKLIEIGDLQSLLLCLDHLKEMSEANLSVILECFLRTEDEKFSNTIPISGMGQERDPSLYYKFHKASAINKILVQPFSDVFLLECLKSIKFELIKDLLSYLSSLVHGSDSASGSAIHQQISISQVVDWINLCLDAHFTQWCLSTDTRELLVNLAQTTEAKQHFYDELQSLDAILTQLKKKCDLPKKKIGQYCITTLHM